MSVFFVEQNQKALEYSLYLNKLVKINKFHSAWQLPWPLVLHVATVNSGKAGIDSRLKSSNGLNACWKDESNSKKTEWNMSALS